MNSLRFPGEDNPRPKPEDLFAREPRALDTYRVPDYATGALPLSPVALIALGVAVIGLTLALFPWVGAFMGAPLGLAGIILAVVAAGRIRRGLERGGSWAASAICLGLVAIGVGVALNLEELVLVAGN
jgi:hypothetical protein